MSFLTEEQKFYERPMLGNGCNCVSRMGHQTPYLGQGLSDILDKVVNPSTTGAISKVVTALPGIIETVRNVVQTNPKELNKKIEESLQSNSSIEDVIKTINKKSGKGSKKKLLSNQSKMILESILQKEGAGIGVL
jgi:hypothetical protein